MKKEKNNKLTLREKATMKLLTPLVEKVLKTSYSILAFYCNDDNIYYDTETNKPTIDIPHEEDYYEIILKELKGENKQ